MEFGSLGLGTPTPAASTQTVGANAARTATLETNPKNVVTPSTGNDATANDLRRDGARPNADGAVNADTKPATGEPLTSRRTTLNFDSEQNRIFLEIVDTSTNEVVERIPSERFVALIKDAVSPPRDISSQTTDEPKDTVAPARRNGK